MGKREGRGGGGEGAHSYVKVGRFFLLSREKSVKTTSSFSVTYDSGIYFCRRWAYVHALVYCFFAREKMCAREARALFVCDARGLTRFVVMHALPCELLPWVSVV